MIGFVIGGLLTVLLMERRFHVEPAATSLKSPEFVEDSRAFFGLVDSVMNMHSIRIIPPKYGLTSARLEYKTIGPNESEWVAVEEFYALQTKATFIMIQAPTWRKGMPIGILDKVISEYEPRSIRRETSGKVTSIQQIGDIDLAFISTDLDGKEIYQVYSYIQGHYKSNTLKARG